MYVNPCLIAAGIVPAINYCNVLPYVGSYIPSAIASGCLLTPDSGVAPSRLALLCGNWFGALRLSWRALLMSIYSPMLAILLVTYCEQVNVYLVYDTCTVDVAMP